MRTKVTVACAMAAFVAIAGGTAEATGLIHTANIARGAVTLDRLSPRVQTMVTAMPKHGTNGIDGIPGAPGATGATGAMGAAGLAGLAGPAGIKGDSGAPGAPGAPGAAGATGDVGAVGVTGDHGDAGAPGAAGAKGDKGDIGTAGAKGDKGDKGDPGQDGTNGKDAPKAEYGVAQVLVSRGHDANGQKPAAVWATYSTLLGSPVGDNTGGTFRFTCSTANAPCMVSVRAAGLGTGNVKVYPRVLIARQDYDTGGPTSYCEYGDGATGSGVATIAKQASTPSPVYTAMQLNIGGSADCNGPDATAGDVNQITVPAGYYDVQSTFVYLP